MKSIEILWLCVSCPGHWRADQTDLGVRVSCPRIFVLIDGGLCARMCIMCARIGRVVHAHGMNYTLQIQITREVYDYIIAVVWSDIATSLTATCINLCIELSQHPHVFRYPIQLGQKHVCQNHSVQEYILKFLSSRLVFLNLVSIIYIRISWMWPPPIMPVTYLSSIMNTFSVRGSQPKNSFTTGQM